MLSNSNIPPGMKLILIMKIGIQIARNGMNRVDKEVKSSGKYCFITVKNRKGLQYEITRDMDMKNWAIHFSAS